MSFIKITCKNLIKNLPSLPQKRDLLISRRFRYHKITTENNYNHTLFNHSMQNADAFPVVVSLPPKNRSYICVSQANLTETQSATAKFAQYF